MRARSHILNKNPGRAVRQRAGAQGIRDFDNGIHTEFVGLVQG